MVRSSQGDIVTDVFNRATRIRVPFDASAGNNFEVRKLMPGILLCELTINTMHQGYKSWGDLAVDNARFSASDLWTVNPGQLCLANLVTNATTPDPTITSGQTMMFFANAFGQFFAASGQATDSSLFSENTSTAVMSALTFNPNGTTDDIMFLGAVTLNSTQSLIVGITAQAAMAVTAAAGTASNMDTSLSYLSGALQSSLPEKPLLMPANGSLWRLDGDSAVAAVPTQLFDDWPISTYGIGEIQLGFSAFPRLYWTQPAQAKVLTDQYTSAQWRTRIVHTDGFGTDVQSFPTPLRYIAGAAAVGGYAVIAHDTKEIFFHDGIAPRTIAIFKERDPGYTYRVVRFDIRDEQVFVLVERDTGSVTSYRWETIELDPSGDTVHAVTPWTDLSTTGRLNYLTTGRGAVSHTTGYAHTYADGSWRRVWLPRPRQNLITNADDADFAASGTLTSTNSALPAELAAGKNVLYEIQCLADTNNGASDGTVLYEVGGAGGVFSTTNMSLTARGSDRFVHRRRRFLDNRTWFTRFSHRITMTRGSTSNITPSATPVVYRWLHFQPGVPVRSAREILGQ